MIHQNGFTRSTLSSTVSKFVEENKVFFLHIGKTPVVLRHERWHSMSKYANHNAFTMFKTFE